jgi:hypothetical protein
MVLNFWDLGFILLGFDRGGYMLAVIIGLLFVIAGGLGVITWKADFVVILKGLMPIMLVAGGMISVIAGIMSIIESPESKISEENEAKEE